ncbi:hypothetical protein JIN85_15340 [Luteolibacter pohnpeiensis]|uniref:C2H2-type domain-containing protein n=1 Tax=Luteolibacter pohnpeiensis TaxID=454153 RepID=A0A934VS13_9BACT|nr:hypothetical protein [Luteolibacter pohnpeiensis]MBK1883791.1 hypothetical protein [Luteolibacter pohnpeiensis]
MLFNYRYVSHPIETFQVWLDHLVKSVWCRNDGAPYSIDLLHPDLKGVILDIYNTEEDTTKGKTGDWLYGPVQRIDALFQIKLDTLQRTQVGNWYDHNNDIEALCGNDPKKIPGTYADLRAINADLEKELKDFCKSLFTDVIHLKAVTRRTAEIDSHYDAFVTVNDEGKCPYCGYGDIKGLCHSKREAYDHFLPKGTYPFNSVNFRNLAPMCHECNSSYKLQKDPVRHIDPLHIAKTSTRRKAFYSYATASSDISIDIAFITTDIAKLDKTDISLTITASGRDEEVESWKDVFGIEERYKAKCCAKNDGMAWLSRVVEEYENYGLTRQKMLEAELRAAQSKPWNDVNFLKGPFLVACQKAGLI